MHELSRRTALVGLLRNRGCCGRGLLRYAESVHQWVRRAVDERVAQPIPVRFRSTPGRVAVGQAAQRRGRRQARRGGGEGARQQERAPAARGLDEADIVFVELDGYRDASGCNSTRLVPVFHSKLAESVGPVRSIRPVDIALLSPMHAIIGNTETQPGGCSTM